MNLKQYVPCLEDVGNEIETLRTGVNEEISNYCNDAVVIF